MTICDIITIIFHVLCFAVIGTMIVYFCYMLIEDFKTTKKLREMKDNENT